MQSSSRNGATVRLVALHTTEGIMRATGLRDWASWAGSSHASCDETGTLLEGAADGFVDYSRAAWTLRAGNPISDNLEMCGWAHWTRTEWLARPALLEGAATWVARRCVARNVPPVLLTPAQVAAGHRGVIEHYTWTVGMSDGTHSDVGPNFPWDVVLPRARQLIASPTAPPSPGGFLMALTDDQQAELYSLVKAQLGGPPLPIAVWSDLVAGPVADATGGPQQVRSVLADVFAHARAAAASAAIAASRSADVDTAALAVALGPLLAGYVTDAAHALSADQLDAIAGAVADEQSRRMSGTPRQLGAAGAPALPGTVPQVPAPVVDATVYATEQDAADAAAERAAIAAEDAR